MTNKAFCPSPRARTLVFGVIAVSAVALTGCSGDTGSTTGASASGNAGASSALAAAVSLSEQPLAAYPVPTDPIANVSSLSGKTVFYIPISLQAPAFTVTGTGLTAGLNAAGIQVQVCDGKGTPTDIGSCLTQATLAGAAVIVTDAISYDLASNAFDAARAADIPVIISNQSADPAHPDTPKLVTIPGTGVALETALSQWFALDSNGSGSMLINQNADGPSPAAYVTQAQAATRSDCPACTVTINPVSASSFSLVPSSTSSALLQNPSIGYVESQYDQFLQPTQAGTQQAGRTDIKGMTGAAGLGSLQALASGNFLYAAAAPALAFQGWVDADASIRLMLAVPVPDYSIPVRLFTRDTIGSITVSDAAQQSGEWFGATTFTDDFRRLWGLK
ncbi:sugar ABC transporter substrate-binding protein [Subtercola sp. YIM 133946]|uniref:sugar ABC transporter substrate-binding protein n=1 Tax=Subtercola sp. YIM 133946 TaxID=3118909 RepID=UPI002F92FD80